MKAKTPVVSGTATVTDGTTTTLTCTSASSPLTGASYVWKQNGVTVTGATSSTYTTPGVAMSNHGDAYTCAVTFNTVTSDDSSTGLTLTGIKYLLCLLINQTDSHFKLMLGHQMHSGSTASSAI